MTPFIEFMAVEILLLFLLSLFRPIQYASTGGREMLLQTETAPAPPFRGSDLIPLENRLCRYLCKCLAESCAGESAASEAEPG